MRKGLLLGLAAALALAIAPQAAPSTTTRVVDKDKVQCPNAQYTSIQAAVNASAPGDAIKVCPDFYNESVTVNKPSLTLVGSSKISVSTCSTETAPDPTKDSVVTGGPFSFSLVNNDISLSGFIVQGAQHGIDTSASFSGYQITGNVAQHNVSWGINLNSSGTNLSHVGGNCLRLNGPATGFSADGLASEIGNLRNALIDHNATYRNQGGGIDLTGAGARAYVTVTANSASGNGFAAYTIDNSIGSSITNNTSQGDGRGIDIGGANNGLKITANTAVGNPANGIVFDQAIFIPAFTGPNVGLNVSGNKVSGAGGSGILAVAGAPNFTLSTLASNNSSGNGTSGIRLQAGNNNNTVINNVANKNNANGIHAEGATGNTFEKNAMSLNVQFDARDDNRPSNTWTNNKCVTDFPTGTIC